MANRGPIKKEHERFHINNFVRWLNLTYRSSYKVISEPEPPEAIIESKYTKSWVEISTAFINSDYARDLMSYITPDEVHKSISGELFVEPDREAAENFVEVVKKKLEKKSYLPIAEKYGQGYLVIPIHNPFFDENTIRLMKEEWHKTKINDLGCFKSVRISYRPKIGITVQSNWKFYLWPKKPPNGSINGR